MKTCTRCKVEQPLENFHRNWNNRVQREYHNSMCKPCRSEDRKEKGEHKRDTERTMARYQNDVDFREKRKAAVRKSNRGVDDGVVDAIFAAQGSRCAICGSTEPNGRGWCLDHDHDCCSGRTQCGKCYRAVLCGQCNMGLGQFRDNSEFLRLAAEYLEMFAGMNASGSATNMGATVSRSTPAI